MRIGELYDGGYLVCWIDAEHFKPNDMTEIIAHLKYSGCDYASDYFIGNYHERENYISDGLSHIDFEKFDFFMNIPPLPIMKNGDKH